MSSYYSDGRGRGAQQRNSNVRSSGSGRGTSGRPTGSGSGRSTNRRKKKKSPIGLLLLVLLLVVGIVAGVNYFKSREEAQTQQQLELEAQQQAEQEDALLNQQIIYEGVTLNGIQLAGMTKEQAAQAVESALGLEEHALTLTYGEQSFTVNLMAGTDLASVLEQAYQVGRDGTREENLATIERIKTDNVDFTVEAGYSLPDMTEVLESCAAAIDCAPVNATVTGFDTKESSFTYADGENGLTVDKDATLAAAQAAVDAGNLDASIQIKVNEVAPDMDKATLKSKFKKLTSFTTTTTSNSNRNTNIRLCSTALSGAVVQPGEEFSVNNTTGKRSAEKGYKDATVIKNGVYVQEPGGGVCQVSSTLFNAVVRAGLKITERHNHTIVSSYVPIGEDAAIDYPNKDFKFVNNSEGPIAIVMSFDESGKKLKATVYGIPILEDGVTLDLTSEVTETIPIPSPTYTEDPTLAYGEEVTVTTGLEGKKVKTYLITKKDGKEVSRELLYSSSYPKRTPVIAINSKAAPEASPAIPEEGDSTGGGEEGGIPDDGSGSSGDDFVIPEE